MDDRRVYLHYSHAFFIKMVFAADVIKDLALMLAFVTKGEREEGKEERSSSASKAG